MPEQSYWLQFYWSARREDVQQCALRIDGLLDDLVKVRSEFDNWQVVDRSLRMRLLETPRVPQLTEALLAGRNCDEIDGAPIPDLGFRVHLCNSATRVEIFIGSYVKRISNTLIIGPIKSSLHIGLCDLATMQAISKVIVEHLDPDDGVVTTDEYRELTFDFPEYAVGVGRLHSGWMIYVSKRHGLPSTLPVDAEVEDIAGHGTLFVATRERFTADRPEHVASARKLWAGLTKAKK